MIRIYNCRVVIQMYKKIINYKRIVKLFIFAIVVCRIRTLPISNTVERNFAVLPKF